jgi:hypothetical protein
MPLEAVIARTLPPPFSICPECGGGRAVICVACERIVGHEEIPRLEEIR